MARMPMRMAPRTRRTSSQAMRKNPAIASRVGGLDNAPRATGAPLTPSVTIPVSFRPMNVRNSPMPTAKLHLSESGMALAIQARTLITVSTVNKTPARKIAPKATCHDRPIPWTTVKAINAFSPM